MLYDPKWETKADPLTLDSLIAWLETQPPEEVYCYSSNGHCLVAQYLLTLGYSEVGVDGRGFYDRSENSCSKSVLHPLPQVFNRVAIFEPRTFGAALARARALSKG